MREGANRTKVGLKQLILEGQFLSVMCANRTKVGLKREVEAQAVMGWLVLIEPRWD